jgi:hypothetical protein
LISLFPTGYLLGARIDPLMRAGAAATSLALPYGISSAWSY